MPRPFYNYIIVMYSTDSGVVLKVWKRHSRVGWYTMRIHVDVVHVFTWIRQYSASRSIFLIIMILDRHFIYMYAFMWSILWRKKP